MLKGNDNFATSCEWLADFCRWCLEEKQHYLQISVVILFELVKYGMENENNQPIIDLICTFPEHLLLNTLTTRFDFYSYCCTDDILGKLVSKNGQILGMSLPV